MPLPEKPKKVLSAIKLAALAKAREARNRNAELKRAALKHGVPFEQIKHSAQQIASSPAPEPSTSSTDQVINHLMAAVTAFQKVEQKHKAEMERAELGMSDIPQLDLSRLPPSERWFASEDSNQKNLPEVTIFKDDEVYFFPVSLVNTVAPDVSIFDPSYHPSQGLTSTAQYIQMRRIVRNYRSLNLLESPEDPDEINNHFS